jgi:hypothetical protein
MAVFLLPFRLSSYVGLLLGAAIMSVIGIWA